MFTKFLAKLCFVSLSLASYSYCSDLPYKEKTVLLEGSNDLSFNETYLGYFKGKKVTLSSQDAEIGSLSYLKVPILPWYALYYFYINPDHRNKGMGRILFKHVLDKVKKLGARKVLLQTGPYEYDDKGAIVFPIGEDRETRVRKLLEFYSSFNFKLLNKTLATLLGGLYIVFRIHEDPKIFMTMNPNQEKKEN